MRIDSAIVDTTKHTHIRRNRIRLQTGSQQIVAIPLESFAVYLTKRNGLGPTKLRKRTNSVFIHVGRRITPLLSQTIDVIVCANGKSIFFHKL